MAITKERKDELVSEYTELVRKSDAIFIAQYAGLTVKEMEQLRVKMADSKGQLNVTKNTLLRIALEANDRVVPEDLLTGQVATGFALGDAPTLAKMLVESAKTNDKLKIRGGLLGNKILSTAEVEALATLPSLDQLRAQILGLISAPAQNIASVVAGGVRQVVNVLDAYSKKDEAAAEAA